MAMPHSEMKPTMLAMVSVWPVTTIAATAPIKAIGNAAITWSEKLTERNMVNSTRNIPTSENDEQDGDHPRGRLLALELSAVFDEVAGGQRLLDRLEPPLGCRGRRRPGRGPPCCTARRSAAGPARG